MGTNNTGSNCRVETYPFQNTGSSAVTALRNHEQGSITSDPQSGVVSGQLVATIVIPVDVSGDFLLNFPFSYEAFTDGTPSVTWQLNRRTGAYTVNGLAPAPGFYLFPTDAGGTVTNLMTTTPLNQIDEAVALGALDISGQPVGSLVAYELLLLASPGGPVHFPGASPTTPFGALSALEVL
jgi:hypothetical protein